MHSRYTAIIALVALLVTGSISAAFAQETTVQRLEVMRSRLETMRRSLNSAIAAMNAQDTGEKKTGADDPRSRLRGLEQEVNSILNEIGDVRSKADRAERVEKDTLDKLEASITDLDARVQSGLRATAGERSAAAASAAPKKKKKKGFLGLFGGGGDDKYEELTGTVAPGRDRVLFEEAAREVRKSNYDTGRLLFNTIITTYPDSIYLPMAKLAIADSFYLEGTTAALIQAAAAYQDWLTFFPTHPLSDDVMLKMAEAEMRQMGLADRDVSRARKAEQRLKVILQQFPNTPLRTQVQVRLVEVQENLAMHNLQVARFYYDARFKNEKGGLKGAQSRLREILEKYPNFTYMDEVLMRFGDTFLDEEEPDEAIKYFQQLLREYPNSPYAEKAKEQLEKIGAPIPEPDPKALQKPVPVRPGMMAKILNEVVGSANVTVDKNGVLISKEEEGNDLIDKVIANQGVLPDSAIPAAPTQRRAPAMPQVQPQAAPKTGTGGVNIQPTPSGRPADPSNPASTTTNPPATTPNTTTPTNTTGTKP
jgi:outer membrane protein assembly factor BamD